jgi:hypothetical protein
MQRIRALLLFDRGALADVMDGACGDHDRFRDQPRPVVARRGDQTAGYSGRDERCVGGGELVELEHAVELDSGGLELSAFVLALWCETSLHAAAEGSHGARSHHAFWGTTDSEQ